MNRVTARSDNLIQRHWAAISFHESLPAPGTVMWLDTAWALAPEQFDLRERLLSAEARHTIEAALASGDRALSARATYALCDRFALRAAAWRLAPEVHESIRLSHTSLGQPVTRLPDSRQPGPLHLSFTHDGDMHLTLAATHPGLRGVGIDVVHLDRLRGERKDRDYLRRFARKFMGDEEYAGFAAASEGENETHLRIRAAAHFSLMEAASKALGTGLKIGVGMGRPESVPKQSIGVQTLAPNISWLLTSDAMGRIRELGATRLTGTWSADAEYLVSAGFLW